jgi:lipid A 4'-phosphatase
LGLPEPRAIHTPPRAQRGIVANLRANSLASHVFCFHDIRTGVSHCLKAGEYESLRLHWNDEPVEREYENSRAPDDAGTMRRYFLVFLTLSTLMAGLFFFFPVIDLWTAARFYDHNRGFMIPNSSSAKVLPFLPWLAKLFVTACWLVIAVNMVRSYFLGKKLPLVASNRVIIFLLFTLGIGPGLVVNTILKDHCGRARPFQVSEFGGNRQFTPAFVISDQCKTNCSFVSGDASLGYFGLAFFFVARRRKIFITSSGVFAGTLIGLVRMAQGAHFLSDVIFSGVFTFLAGWLLYFLILHQWQIRQTASNKYAYEKSL